MEILENKRIMEPAEQNLIFRVFSTSGGKSGAWLQSNNLGIVNSL